MWFVNDVNTLYFFSNGKKTALAEKWQGCYLLHGITKVSNENDVFFALMHMTMFANELVFISFWVVFGFFCHIYFLYLFYHVRRQIQQSFKVDVVCCIFSIEQKISCWTLVDSVSKCFRQFIACSHTNFEKKKYSTKHNGPVHSQYAKRFIVFTSFEGRERGDSHPENHEKLLLNLKIKATIFILFV